MNRVLIALAVTLVVMPALAQQGPRGQRPQGPPAQMAQRAQFGPPGERTRQGGVLQANGDGRVMVVPDIAVVTIGVTSQAATAAEALAANSTDLTAAIAAIRTAGVAEEDIGTSGFSLSPVYQPLRDVQPDGAPQKIIGYRVSNQVRVTIRDVASSGGILDKVVAAGANQVNGISFDIADRQSAEDEAIAAAIAEAKRRGALMAEAAGVTLEQVMNVNANAGGGGPVFARMEMSAAAPTPVMPGQQAVTANASITWALGE